MDEEIKEVGEMATIEGEEEITIEDDIIAVQQSVDRLDDYTVILTSENWDKGFPCDSL